jgi:hypothetical protein
VKQLARLALVGLLLTAAAPVRAGEVRVSFSNGLVTIVATDASPRQILGEWAKLGQVRITNLDRLAGGPVTIQLTNVPEAQALETLLRGTAGYVAAPRASAGEVAAVSRFDRILLMPGSAPALPAITPGPAPSQPGASRGRPNMPTFDPGDDNTPDDPRVTPGPNGMARDVQRPGGAGPAPGPYAVPGQIAMPGQTTTPDQAVTPGQYGMQGSPYQPSSGVPGAATPGRAVPSPYQRVTTSPIPDGPQGGTGTVAPGMPTSPISIPVMPYSNAGPPAQFQFEDSATWPGQATVPGRATVTGARPGEITTPTPAMFRNPYGLPEPVRPPVVDPYANPYGLPNTVKTPATTPSTTPGATTPGATTPGTTLPTVPIKKDPAGKG